MKHSIAVDSGSYITALHRHRTKTSRRSLGNREWASSVPHLPGLCAKNVLHARLLTYIREYIIYIGDVTIRADRITQTFRPSRGNSRLIPLHGFRVEFATVNASFPVRQWSSTLGSVGFPNGYRIVRGENNVSIIDRLRRACVSDACFYNIVYYIILLCTHTHTHIHTSACEDFSPQSFKSEIAIFILGIYRY